MNGRPFVSVDPAMQSGQPCLNHTRMPIQTIADWVWGHGIDGFLTGFDDRAYTRHDALVACWYAGRYGLPREPFWTDRWGAWAQQVEYQLWHTAALTDQVLTGLPDPPNKSGIDGGEQGQR